MKKGKQIMDIYKCMEFDSFLKFKNMRSGIEFPVSIKVLNYNGNQVVNLNSNILIEKNVKKSDHILTFMEDMVRTYVGGYVQMWVSYLSNVKFDGECLHFTTSNGIDIEVR